MSALSKNVKEPGSLIPFPMKYSLIIAILTCILQSLHQAATQIIQVGQTLCWLGLGVCFHLVDNERNYLHYILEFKLL